MGKTSLAELSQFPQQEVGILTTIILSGTKFLCRSGHIARVLGGAPFAQNCTLLLKFSAVTVWSLQPDEGQAESLHVEQ